MGLSKLIGTANALVANDKGLLAIDESNSTCNKRFAKLGIAETQERRRAYRLMIVTTRGLSDYISGVILYDETIRQSSLAGEPIIEVLVNQGIIPGIKVDLGAKALAGRPFEKVTEGLDGLRDRLSSYAAMGARFAKWRAVFAINNSLPSRGCIAANAHALARNAALCQEAGLVPIVEPEVLMDGAHTLEKCARVSEAVLRRVFEQLSEQGVVFEGMLLKPSMVVAGLSCPTQPSLNDVAASTVNCLLRTVPAAVPGIAFLSGGQSPELAPARLDAINSLGKSQAPWALTFSFGRAIQQPALDIWQGDDANVDAAQQALLQYSRFNFAARRSEYHAAMERTMA